MSKKFLLCVGLLLIQLASYSQNNKHIKWAVASKKLSANSVEIYFKATLDPTWHIWSQTPGDDMLIPPTFSFEDKTIKMVGKAKEIGKKITKKEEGFKNNLTFYEGSVIFAQKLTIKTQKSLKGTINYQICDPKSCLPPTDYDFSVVIK